MIRTSHECGSIGWCEWTDYDLSESWVMCADCDGSRSRVEASAQRAHQERKPNAERGGRGEYRGVTARARDHARERSERQFAPDFEASEKRVVGSPDRAIGMLHHQGEEHGRDRSAEEMLDASRGDDGRR